MEVLTTETYYKKKRTDFFCSHHLPGKYTQRFFSQSLSSSGWPCCRWHDRNRADPAAHNRDPSFLSGARFQHYHAGACLYFPREKIYIICNFKLFYVSDCTGILQSDPWRLCSDRQSDPMHTLCWHRNRNLPWNDHPYRCFYRWRRRSATDLK